VTTSNSTGKGKDRGIGFGTGESNAFLGHRDGDTGSAARFFATCPADDGDYDPLMYCAKASRAEREAGCEGMEEHLAMRYGEKAQGPLPQQTPSLPVPQRNHHPTVKPLALMRYLLTLVRQPTDNLVLDPFMGSGSTGVAAAQLGIPFVGIEQDAEYYEIARRRIAAAGLPLLEGGDA